eukprot:SAG31_NODE_4929_length_2855_cov_1.699057_4_plen_64_part_00
MKEAERRSQVVTAARDKIASLQADASSGTEIEKYSHIDQVPPLANLFESANGAKFEVGLLSGR